MKSGNIIKSIKFSKKENDTPQICIKTDKFTVCRSFKDYDFETIRELKDKIRDKLIMLITSNSYTKEEVREIIDKVVKEICKGYNEEIEQKILDLLSSIDLDDPLLGAKIAAIGDALSYINSPNFISPKYNIPVYLGESNDYTTGEYVYVIYYPDKDKVDFLIEKGFVE